MFINKIFKSLKTNRIKKKTQLKPGDIFIVFLLYVLVVAFYWIIYMNMYLDDHTSFTFNSEIKNTKLRESVTPIVTNWKEYLADKQHKEIVDTVHEVDKFIVQHHLIFHQFTVGKDTFLFNDTNQVNEQFSRIAIAYDKYENLPIWHDLDFLYFSFITISTVGYGDILPNSTTVRMVVVSEVLLGQFILIFLLGMLFTKLNKKNGESGNEDVKEKGKD